ncbi:NYN domain-containing protein [Amycolatopsis thailandensis]|uniref:NYN domain-containing protein n=1 Tax=Amycolatopsis thailandensis TaxID=589330 RepID=UPI00362A56B3
MIDNQFGARRPPLSDPLPESPVDSEAVRMVRDAEAAQKRRNPFMPEVGDRGEQLALLIDFENLVLGAFASLPGRADPVPAKALTWLCRAYGSTTIRRAYGDWAESRFGRYQPALERNGIDLVQLGHGPGRKNGADIRMAVDAMETLLIHPGVDAFVLVSGDSDFSPLVAKLREHGKYVIGVGAESAASARLVSVCTEYKLFGSIVARVDPPAGDTIPGTAKTGTGNAQSPSPAAPPGFRLADAERLLVTAMEQASVAAPTAGGIKNKMIALDPAFDEANYGCRSFREFLTKVDHRVRVVGRSGNDITVTLISPPADGVPPAGSCAAQPATPTVETVDAAPDQHGEGQISMAKHEDKTEGDGQGTYDPATTVHSE